MFRKIYLTINLIQKYPLPSTARDDTSLVQRENINGLVSLKNPDCEQIHSYQLLIIGVFTNYGLDEREIISSYDVILNWIVQSSNKKEIKE